MRFKSLLLLIVVLNGSTSFGSLQWTQKADFASSSRHRASSASCGNKGYVGLGHYNGTGVETYFSDWWEYDPATNAWTQKADFIGNNGNGELGARVISLDSVCFVGLGELDHTRLYKFDPSTNSWSQVSSPPASNQFRDTQDMVIGHKAYFTDLWGDELYEYDCDLDLWIYKGLLPLPWYFVFSAFTLNDCIFVKAYDQIWRYDPNANSWWFVNNFPGVAELASVAFVQHDKAYIVCGHGATGSEVTSEVWEFDPITYGWTQIDDFPGTSRRYSTGFSIGDRSYLSTGTNGTNFKDLWEFNVLAGVGLDDFEVSELNVYPNPVMEKVTFSSSKNLVYDVSIADLAGREVSSGSTINGTLELDRGNYRSGVYVYTIKTENQVVHSGRIVFR